jgi:hypothetical protein
MPSNSKKVEVSVYCVQGLVAKDKIPEGGLYLYGILPNMWSKICLYGHHPRDCLKAESAALPQTYLTQRNHKNIKV